MMQPTVFSCRAGQGRAVAGRPNSSPTFHGRQWRSEPTGSTLAGAAIAAGADGLFMEVHDRPSEALSDGANAMPIEKLADTLEQLQQIDRLVKGA